MFTTLTPATDHCLALWEDEISAARRLSRDERLALSAIKGKVSDEYRKAAPYLLDDVGRYCAYCELPVHEPLQIEHVVPKSEYPTFSLDWDNFLPACTGCNSRKGSVPARALVATWLGSTPSTPTACRDEIRTRRYRWPDGDPVAGFFAVGLYYDDPAGGGWAKCDDADAVERGVRLLSSSWEIGEVCADIPALGEVSVAALVYDAAGDQRTQETIDLCKLDRRLRPKDASDTRTRYRTETWLAAVETLRPLADDGLPTTLPPTIERLVIASGFYWVWLTVAELIDQDLRRLLVDGTRASFPGTDDARLP